VGVLGFDCRGRASNQVRTCSNFTWLPSNTRIASLGQVLAPVARSNYYDIRLCPLLTSRNLSELNCLASV
jgi:hypothetical protein